MMLSWWPKFSKSGPIEHSACLCHIQVLPCLRCLEDALVSVPQTATIIRLEASPSTACSGIH
jgi:hypothetical protein